MDKDDWKLTEARIKKQVERKKENIIMKTITKISTILLSTTLLFGCASNTDDSIPVVGVAQIVSHTSLNTIRDSFSAQMEELGYIDGENIEINYADASNQQSNLNSIITQFEDDESDVIVAIATPTAQAAANAAETIPVVFSAVSDPVGSKLVSDPEHPDLNITGTSDKVQVDQILDLALQIDPSIKTIGFLYNAAETNSVSNLEKAKEYCKANNLELIEGTGKDMTELQSSAVSLCEKVDILFAPNDNTVASGMQSLSQIALDAKIPFYTGADSMVQDGGFATVGIDYEELGKETANMVDQILNGTPVSDIPVKVFKDNLNIYINQNALDTLGIQLSDDIKNNDRLIMVE